MFKRTIAVGAAVAAAALVVPGAASAGLLDASASPGSGSGAVLDLPGLLTLGKSTETANGSNVQVLSVGGINLLGKSASSTGGTNTGALAPVGAVVDQVNSALCPNAPSNPGTCVAVLYSYSNDTHKDAGTLGTADTHNASYSTAAVNLGDVGLFVAGSEAAGAKTTSAGKSTCVDGGRSYVLVTKGTALPPDTTSGLQKLAASASC